MECKRRLVLVRCPTILNNHRFRWITLQVDAVKKCKSKAELNKQLTSLPKDLNAAYAQIFERSEFPDHLQLLLQWIVFSEEPMSVTQLAEVLAVDFKRSEFPLYDPDLRYRNPANIWGICYGLVTEFQGALWWYNVFTILIELQEMLNWRTCPSRNIFSSTSPASRYRTQ